MDASQHDCDVASTAGNAWHDIPWVEVYPRSREAAGKNCEGSKSR